MKKETQKPQNRHDDEDQLENIEVQQKLTERPEFAHGVVPWSFLERTKTSSFCRGNPRSEEPANGKKISFCQIHTKKSRDLSSDSLKFRSS